MNLFYRLSFVSFLFLLITSCNNEVPILAEKQENPVVYCIINPTDTIHFVRLGNSTQDYESPESFLVDEGIVVTAEEINDSQIVNSFAFSLQDSIIKDDGDFLLDNNSIFYTVEPFKSKKTYRLTVQFPLSQKTVNATTTMLEAFTIEEPSPEVIRKIDLATEEYYIVQWNSCPLAVLYEVSVHFNYTEISPFDTVEKSLIYKNPRIILNGSTIGKIISDRVYSESFMNNIAKKVDINAEVSRIVKSIQFEIFAGNEDVYFFMEAMNTDINMNNIHFLSNVNNGIGLFGSIYSSFSDTLELTGNTIDSISYGIYTKDLNFADRWGSFH